MKIGIYVGSFNPVHTGHIKIANHLLENYLDKVIFVATGNYWQKNNLISVSKRIQMLKYYENDRIIIDDEHNELPYTHLVMDEFTKKYPNDTIYLIIGADNLVSFDKWKEYKTLLTYNLIIIEREGINIPYYLKKFQKEDRYIIVESFPGLDVSSTMIRKNIKSGEYEKLEDKIDTQILKHIIENKYYV